jgi:hypothetical protein
VIAERQGVPAVGVMTTRFASAAELMSKVLGLPGYAFVQIEHPVSSADDEALAARARATIEQGLKLLIRA